MEMSNKFSRVRKKGMSLRNKVLGFSLVELMIAIALGLILMLGVTTVFVNTSATRAEIERSSRQMENGRYVMEVLSNELQLAGYLGELGVNTTVLPTPGTLPGICVGYGSADNVQAALPIHVQGINDMAAGSEPTCISGLSASTFPGDKDIQEGTDILVVRRASTCVDTDADCSLQAAFNIQTALCKDDIVPFKVANSGSVSDFPLKKHDCATRAPIRRLYTHIYYIAKNNKAGDGVRTLKRLVLSNGVVAVDPIAEGVDNLQVMYGMDTNNDGAPDTYTATPASAAEWRNVTTVKLGVLVRNLEKTAGHQQSRFYDLAGTVVGPYTDDVKRHAYTETVRLTNVIGRRE
jgi:type IV pilus assembly protein PilW